MEDKLIWNYLISKLNNQFAVAGIIGNLYAESNLNAKKLQSSYQTKLNFTNETYTNAVDSGTYTNFVYDSAGYGIAQWSYWSRKQALLDYIKSKKVSIGNLEAQLEFLYKELKTYPNLINNLIKCTSVREASDIILTQYEKPANQSEAVKIKRAELGQNYYNKFVVGDDMAINFDKYIKSIGTHYISNSGSDENKQYTGGKAGDQTGHEWELKAWYNRPWTVVLRYPIQAVAQKIAELSIAAPLNNKIGYDQAQRGTYWTQLKAANYNPSNISVACEEDCTAGVSANVRGAGYLCNITDLKNIPLCTSRNMRAEFVKAGFKALTASKYLYSAKYLLPGDILLYENHHAAANVTLGSAVKNDWNPDFTNIDNTPVQEEVKNEVEKPYVQIINGTAHIRKGPSTNYGSLGTAKVGEKFKYFGYNYTNGWRLIEFNEQTGWVSNKYSDIIT